MNTQITLGEVRGPLGDLLDKISDSENGDQWLRALKQMLRKENPWEAGTYRLPTWRTIKFNMDLKTAVDFQVTLKKEGYRITDNCIDILGKTAFTACLEHKEVDLVITSAAELGFANGATRKEIYDRARKQGLGLCANEVGPQLRFLYKDQPKGEWILIAMEPIADSDAQPRIFFLEHDDDALWLDSGDGNPVRFWDADDRWVFLRHEQFSGL